MTLTKQLLIAVVLLLLVGGGATWWVLTSSQAANNSPGGPGPGGFAVPVELAQAETKTLIRTVEAVGTLSANERVMLRPELGGRVVKILFEEGQVVQAGDPLVGLDDSIYRAEVAQAKANVDLSRIEYKRTRELHKRNAVSVNELDQARSELEANEAALALAQARLDKSAIKAPFTGVLGLRRVSVGDYVSPGQDLVNLVDIGTIKVDFRVPEVFLVDVAVGQAIEVKMDAFAGEVFTGEVYAIDPQIDVRGRSIVIRARIPNEDGRLRPGLFGRVNVIVERREHALVVPEEAVFPQGQQQFVYEVVEGKAELRPVGLGLRQQREIEILSGLAPGAQVITAGHIKVRPGGAVQPVGQGAPGPAKGDASGKPQDESKGPGAPAEG